ncbi:MmcQ/YjbR family DNA-binding protein (plasmid) [Hymenobacter tibetensis]|uniref:MmcQ/YjbR family DNA-binding protein n=1 Tax=Hymenobacter tibetensis TaxID=497967 RepID=A0ABY4D4W0_9BACT|nr:MmcQ/YjbR family DNA-binding protein [Hymenobacter tibetensis]UOG77398.1 MmcQ/YjbR family DNA-binding protein [Hymenobacter tibetensis]
MDIEQFRACCLALPFTEEKTPFAGFFPNARDILAFYIGGKIFCYFDLDKFDKCSLKSTPERIAELKERYQAAGNPFNMSPKYWLSVAFNDDLPDALLLDLVQGSYDLVLASLPKKQREQLRQSGAARH